MKKRVLAAMAMVACVAMGGVANADVSFNPTDGTGFVGQVDVQIAQFLNNEGLQNA